MPILVKKRLMHNAAPFHTKVSKRIDFRKGIFAVSSRGSRRPSGAPRARHEKFHRPSAAYFQVTPRVIRDLLGLALIGDCVHRRSNGFLVAEVVAFDRLQIVVEFINERDAGRDVELENLFLSEVVEILHKGAEAVAMGCNDHALA